MRTLFALAMLIFMSACGTKTPLQLPTKNAALGNSANHLHSQRNFAQAHSHHAFDHFPA
jgi:predicted small lipoprotein YifL